MIKAVDKIPEREPILRNSRAQTVKNDISEALYNRIPKFEFVGEIYCPNKVHVTFLSKSLVEDKAFNVINHYIWTIARQSPIHIAKIPDAHNYFKVYRCPEADRERIFMEIYFDKLDYLAEMLLKGAKQ